MKAFRGTLIAAVALLLLVGAVLLLRPDLLSDGPEGPPRLFQFEKHELVRIEVARPDGDVIALAEKDGQWTIEGTDFTAGRSMVNRVKHQIHDLTARATVVEDPEQPELYGLGKNATQVKLQMRDGKEMAFLAGDPNPSSVSYYIQPLPGSVVYTVKKAAVDYYSLTLDEFRERRFASFDSKDATRIQATLRQEGGDLVLDIERVGDNEWQMHAPTQMGANDDRVRRLLGRVSALKASDFMTLTDADRAQRLVDYGLNPPRADITVRFASREPLHVLVGQDSPADNRFEELAYMMLEGDDTVYVARRGLLEEFSQDPAELRNRRVVSLATADVVSVDASLKADGTDDLKGEHGVRFAAEQWLWKDGVPVPGSTPERVARTLAELEVDAFVEDAPTDLSAYGLADPLARAVLADKDGNERVVLIGSTGAPEVDPEGREHARRYAAIEGDPAVYLVSDRSLNVIKDLIREGNRKAEADADKAARRERIPSASGEGDALPPEGQP